ncbi:MAG: NTP transferase domain-containing protein [Ornithinimicrobium sp.]|uniref:molybdenum cofactor guanylyltransferase n=1 Tax=Ornithinimicrobium sp. TaxID=1977084 RepID=UPI0026DF81E1|nr:NTP transferase domain-containing protein [Ornithinimicrobium sp.]MDO5739014.1 NTP transferase domain-containing protein [Ornithinimicrobium sp.]
MNQRPDHPVDLLILAGGRGERLGGADKAALLVGGTSLLSRILGGVGPDGAEPLGGQVVVVGQTLVPDGILVTVEEPPDGGPVAGIAAGLEALDATDRQSVPEWVAVIAVDQPSAARALATLRDQLAVVPESIDAVSHVDASNHRQWLLGLYRRDRLQAALTSLPTVHGASVRTLVSDLAWLTVTTDQNDLGDVDTWEDVRVWEERLARPDPDLRD